MSLNTFKGILNKNLKYPKYFYSYIGNKLFVVVVFCLLIGVLDGFGLAMFMPLLQLSDGSAEVNPESLGKLNLILDLVKVLGLSLNLHVTLTFLVIFFSLKGLLTYYGNAYKVSVQQYFVKNIRIGTLQLLSNIEFRKFVLSDVGRIQNTMSGEVGRLSLSLNYYLSVVQNVVMVMVYVSFAFIINAKFAIIVSLGGYLSSLLFNNIYKRTKKESGNLTKESNLYQGLLIQFISNFKYLKATGGIQILNEKLTVQIEAIEKNNRKLGMITAMVTGVREPSLVLIVAAAIIFETYVMGAPLSTILVSLLFFYRALSSLLSVQNFYNSFLGTSGSMENMRDFIHDLKGAQEKNGIDVFTQFKQGIQVKDGFVRFGDFEVLKNINLSINKNESVALIGESGSGKTTLLNLVCGLIPLTSGEFIIDGQEVNRIDVRSFQRRIGYITQEPVIFNATIYENISFWAPKNPKNIARYNEVLRLASLDGFVEELPLQSETPIGINGVNLSGGQRQRISIARELFKDADVLIMDEATSALDSETEKAIQESLDFLKGKFTFIVVAHRLSTVKSADRILIMNKGSIIESGSYNELLNNSAVFSRMVELQEL